MMDAKLKILYVDDEEINLKLFKLNFSKKFDVLMASDGYKGLEVLAHNRDIKVVVSDMRMPGLTGLEFIEEAKQDYDHILFFILTGYDISEAIKEALESDRIKGYFQKPVRMKEIEATILQACQ